MISTRRQFLGASLLASLGGWARAVQGEGLHLLVRSGWQTVNIGDIAHTPGLLRLLATHLPRAKVTLWAGTLDRGVKEILQTAFPSVAIIHGSVGDDGLPDTQELAAVWKSADLFIHGSGPSVVAHAHMAGWKKHTGKPYGIMGVTIGEMDDALRDLLNSAAFIYCRDGVSLSFLKAEKIHAPVMEFAPDATFAFDLRDATKADAFLTKHALEPGTFLCAIPRLRYTPYHEIHQRSPTKKEKERAAVSLEFKEPDHAKLRAAMELFIQRTGRKVVVCPEMTYEVALGKEILIDPLPESVRKNVIWRDSYWLPDEAASFYAKALALVSFEMHSPILAVAAGTPAIHLRQPTDTSKGQMWRDIGLKNWIFEIDQTTGHEIGTRVLEIHDDPAAARQLVATALTDVRQWHTSAMKTISSASP